MIWMNAEGRDQARAHRSGIVLYEIVKFCAETWKSMNPEDKSKWEKMSEDLAAEETTRRANVGTRVTHRPSAFLVWVNEHGREYAKSQYPDITPTESVSFCGYFWRQMPAAEKRRWMEKARALESAYDRENAANQNE